MPDEEPPRCVVLCCAALSRLLRPAPDDQCAREQALSGICSYRCWCALNPPGSKYSAPERYGQHAQEPSEHGVQVMYNM